MSVVCPLVLAGLRWVRGRPGDGRKLTAAEIDVSDVIVMYENQHPLHRDSHFFFFTDLLFTFLNIHFFFIMSFDKIFRIETYFRLLMLCEEYLPVDIGYLNAYYFMCFLFFFFFLREGVREKASTSPSRPTSNT